MFKVKGKSTIFWEATIKEESGELNHEDALARAREEAEDAFGDAFPTPGVSFEVVGHHHIVNDWNEDEEDDGGSQTPEPVPA